MSVELPGEELFISACEVQGDTLSLRLFNHHQIGMTQEPEAAQTLCLEVTVVADINEAEAFLRKAHEANEAVYLARTESGLSFSTEHGEEYEIHAGTMALQLESYNAAEWREVALYHQALHQQQHNVLRASAARINTALNLVTEQVRRIEVKSAAHAAGTTAATLYAQQQALLERLHEVLAGVRDQAD